MTSATLAVAPAEGPRRAKDRKLLLGASSLFVATYATSAVVGLASARGSDGYLAVPLAGPWIDLGNRDCTIACGGEGFARGMLVASGIVQAVSVVGAAIAVLAPRDDTREAREEKAEVRVVPASLGARGAGLVAVGRF